MESRPLVVADATGRILAVRGSIVDLAFPGELPHLYEALKLDHGGRTLFFEVQQLLQPRKVRAIALGRTEGLVRGLPVERTGQSIHVPVGPAIIGRMFNALGEPLDGQPLPRGTDFWPIHRPFAPKLAIPPRMPIILETGIKIIDLLAPVALASTTGIIGGGGLGKTILLHELVRTVAQKPDSLVVFAGVGERTGEGNALWLELRETGVLANSIIVLGQMSEPAGIRLRVALTALTMAEYFRDRESRDVILAIDSISRHAQAGSEVSGLMGRLPGEMGYQPTLASDLGKLEERIAANTWGGITSIQAVFVPADDLTDPVVTGAFVHMDTYVVLSRARAAHGLYPAIDPILSNSNLLEPGIVGERHFQVAMRVKQAIQRTRSLADFISMLGMKELRHEDQLEVHRARRLEQFLTQPFFSTASVTGQPGKYVSLEDTLAGCEAILTGQFDDVDERRLHMIGPIGDAMK